MQAKSLTLNSRWTINVRSITETIRLITITANIKQFATSIGLSHFRDAYRTTTPIMNGERYPKIKSAMLSVFPIHRSVYATKLSNPTCINLDTSSFLYSFNFFSALHTPIVIIVRFHFSPRQWSRTIWTFPPHSFYW